LKNKKENVYKSEILKIDTESFIQMMTKVCVTYIEKDMINKHPSIFIKGQPGVGKSQSIHAISKILEEKTHKKVFVTDIRLLLFNPIDLRGIPVPNINEKVAVWLKPEIFNLDDSKDTVNILFLDELTAALPSVQAAAYQIALDRKLGEHKLPNNTFIIAAGNREEDYSVAYEMPHALKNRFMHIELIPKLDTWLSWAVSQNIHERVISFLESNPNQFITKTYKSDDEIIITPRSWEMLSNLLYMMPDDLDIQANYIRSVLGLSLSHLFINQVKGIDIKQLFKGKDIEAPQTVSELHQVVDVLTSEIETYQNDIGKMTHVLNYMNKLPVDFAIKVFRTILQADIHSYDITEIKGYNDFLNQLGDIDE
jgi:DNA replication protein DnaC